MKKDLSEEVPVMIAGSYHKCCCQRSLDMHVKVTVFQATCEFGFVFVLSILKGSCLLFCLFLMCCQICYASRPLP
jgi:hypothetical protein